MKKTLVVAGNYAQFRNWQYEKPEERKEARYVMSRQDLVGLDGDEWRAIFTGLYWMRGDITLIREELAKRGIEWAGRPV